MKKILVISPTPSHPQNAGNRARIFSLLKQMQELGNEIHFVYVDYEYRYHHVREKSDIRAMKETWDNFYYINPDFKSAVFLKFKDSIFRAIGINLKKTFPRFYNFLRIRLLDKNNKRYQESDKVDFKYPPYLDKFIQVLKTKYQFGESLEELERNMGIALDSISKALRELEDNGFVAISRHTKPFKYAVIK